MSICLWYMRTPYVHSVLFKFWAQSNFPRNLHVVNTSSRTERLNSENQGSRDLKMMRKGRHDKQDGDWWLTVCCVSVPPMGSVQCIQRVEKSFWNSIPQLQQLCSQGNVRSCSLGEWSGHYLQWTHLMVRRFQLLRSIGTLGSSSLLNWVGVVTSTKQPCKARNVWGIVHRTTRKTNVLAKLQLDKSLVDALLE